VLLDVWHGHLEFTDQPRLIVQKWQEWNGERVGIEDNAYQAALSVAVIKDAMVPVKRLTHTGDKYTRIMTMTPYFENGQVYCREATEDEPGWTDQTRLSAVRIHEKFRKFYEQAVTYGATAAQDDILDALENAMSLAKVRILPNDLYQ
jgi:predicted phage terminase large subunit-like protein